MGRIVLAAPRYSGSIVEMAEMAVAIYVVQALLLMRSEEVEGHLEFVLFICVAAASRSADATSPCLREEGLWSPMAPISAEHTNPYGGSCLAISLGPQPTLGEMRPAPHRSLVID